MCWPSARSARTASARARDPDVADSLGESAATDDELIDPEGILDTGDNGPSYTTRKSETLPSKAP
jgi:hypothetical protein